MTGPHLYLLGGFDFAGVGAVVPAFSRKARAMMAYLALQAGHSQSREKLATLLWSANSEAQARMSLRQAVSATRKALQASGGRLLTDGDNVVLHLDELDFDVARFEALAASSTAADLEQALLVYRGDLLEGFGLKEEPFEDWLRVEREGLRAMAVAALDRLVAHYSALDPASCVRAATRLLTMEPLREDIHRALMRALAAQGRTNLALKQYEDCRRVLQRELNLQPEPETRSLYEELRRRRMAPQVQSRTAGPASPAGASPATHADERPAFGGEQQQASTHYAKSAGINIAYQVTGDGPIDLIYVPGWVSNLDLAWSSPRLSRVLHRLGTFSRLIRMDKRGTGLSDRSVGLPTLEERMEDMRAVLDAVGSKRTVLFGSSEGGPMCMLFAATYPERTAALVLNGTYARGTWSRDYPWARTSEQVEEDLAAVERQWGEPADMSNAAPSLMNDSFEKEWFAAYLRNSASPADAIALWRWGTEIDVRDILPAIHVPALIVQTTGDRWVNPEEGRYLATHIEGARYIELAGRDHVIWGENSDRLVDEIQSFVTGTLPAAPDERILVSVLLLEMGNPPYCDGADLVERHTEEIRAQLLTAEGRQIRHSENRFLAVFQRPTQSIQCAIAIRHRLRQSGVDIRCAVHTGECEERGDDLTGIAIELASRLLDHAEPGDIIASRTVRDLVVGSSLIFQERGDIEASGLPGILSFFRVSESPSDPGAGRALLCEGEHAIVRTRTTP
ncbi:alpha/beta fold hydrolase [Mesorhizobium sp. Root172]|uniref:alpha/beta fold hydrolase n=2 Tax=Phyllobacteriaceae TaxID=69277 RepID=UPI0009C17E1C|nr:alpha/beta fold hydrolase [Mesorhizobium sp. Root172]QKC70628.1 alpha/beta fold hydrolase [Mesorhizobium loti]QKC89589.1 alpha/beta fold hydrolase [Mesorhizobium sp. NZP2234]